MIQQNVGGHPVAVFRFPPRTKFADNSTITVWSGTADPIEHQPPKDFVWKEQQKWGTGPECTTILCKPNGQVRIFEVKLILSLMRHTAKYHHFFFQSEMLPSKKTKSFLVTAIF